MRSRRRWLIGAGIALFAAIAIGVAVSWHFSSAVLVPDQAYWPEEVTVGRLAPDRIVLSRDEDTERPGVYGLDWPEGHAIVGAIAASDADSVTRRLRLKWGYLTAGMKVAVDANVYTGDPGQAFGLPFAKVDVPDELGPLPGLVGAGAQRHLGDRRPRDQRHSPGRPACRARPAPRRPASPVDHLPRGSRRPAQPRRLPPYGADRVARSAGRRPLCRSPRGAPPRPGRLLDGRRDRGAVHAALAAGIARRRAGPRCSRAQLEAGARIQRNRDGTARLHRPSGRVGDRRSDRRRLGQPRRSPVPRGLPPADLAVPWRGRQGGANLDQRRLRRRASALGDVLPRSACRPRRGLECRPPPL